MFQHRHYVFIAQTIAGLDMSEAERATIAGEFASRLGRDNSRFDHSRFMSAARGNPSNGRDK